MVSLVWGERALLSEERPDPHLCLCVGEHNKRLHQSVNRVVVNNIINTF